MDSAISATPIAVRCIKSSTQPCNLHRQTLAVEWAELKSSVTFNVEPSSDVTFPTSQFVKISALLELPRATVSAVIVKWKHLGTTTAQLPSGRPHKFTERDRRVLKHVAWKNRLSSIATLTTEFQTDSGSNVSTSTVRESFMKWVSMAEQPHTSLRSPCAMPSIGWSCVKLTVIGL